MEQFANGVHSSQHLLYSLQQAQSEFALLQSNSNNNIRTNAMDMSMQDRQRVRLNVQQQQLNWTGSEQMNGPFNNCFPGHSSASEMFSDAEWQQFAAQNGHLMMPHREVAMFGRSMPLKNQLDLQNGWPNLSNNLHNAAMVRNGEESNIAVTATTSLTAPFPSESSFAERVDKFSSFNGNGQMLAYQKASVEEAALNTSESVSNGCGNEQQMACSNDSEGSMRICSKASVEKATSDAEKLTTIAEESVVSQKISAGDAKCSNDIAGRKRKSDRTRPQDNKVTDSEESKEKRTRTIDSGAKEKEDLKTKREQSNSDNSVESTPKAAKENAKASENQKQDYIHVRARRGQATDSHSLAERVRREKISERMKYLQDLVPGCNKVTGKAVMLDEIINYVQSLQRQVEFLSMKLAAVNPRLDLNNDNFFVKEIMAPCGNFPSVGGVSPELAPYLQFHQMHQQQASLQGGVCCGLDIPTVVSSADTTSLHRTATAPVSAEMFVDANFQGHATSPWDSELQNMFSAGLVQGRQIPFSSQGIPGHLETNHMKMEL